MKAEWKGAVIAESDDTVGVEGNHYFPREAVVGEYVRESETHSNCSWKGEASYYDVVVKGEVNKDAAWYYPMPKEAAKQIAADYLEGEVYRRATMKNKPSDILLMFAIKARKPEYRDNPQLAVQVNNVQSATPASASRQKTRQGSSRNFGRSEAIMLIRRKEWGSA